MRTDPTDSARADAALRSAHAAFVDAAYPAPAPVVPALLALGRAAAAVIGITIAVLRDAAGPDPIDLEPRVLRPARALR